MQVAVCVITYRRPAGLRRLLESLGGLTFRGEGPGICCQVIDNDSEGSSQSVVESVRPGFRWPLRYAIEPRRGIPFARNAALREVLPLADWIAFIDDDEVPDPGWLDELIRVGAEHGADVVAGPVEPQFEEEPPAWVVEGRFLARPRRETGTQLDRAGTGNVILRASLVKSADVWFDERMAMTGGSDILFFRRLHRRGGRVVWADRAVAREWVPATRTSAGWICRRAFRYGCSTTRIELVLGPVGLAVPRVMVLAGYKLVKGAVFALPAACLRGRVGWVRQVRLAYYGAGMLYGLLGGRYEAYRAVDGE